VPATGRRGSEWLTVLRRAHNTRKFVEIDWSGGVPIASSGRQGIGY
jgi:hypothetical protein